jgi:hypothetical protein
MLESRVPSGGSSLMQNWCGGSRPEHMLATFPVVRVVMKNPAAFSDAVLWDGASRVCFIERELRRGT